MRVPSPVSPAVLTALSLLALLGCETSRTPQQAPVAAVTGATNTREASESEKAPVPAAKPAHVSKLDYIKERAEAEDANAQMVLAQMYDSGKGVKQSDAEGFKWWLKAANQGLRVAQHNVGVAYVAGLGVKKDRDEAVEWLTKAADQGDSQAREYAERLKKGLDATRPVVAEGGPQAAPLAARRTRPARYGQKEEICADVVANFVASHKYIPGTFVCVEYAAGVWYELMQKGINAKIRVGSKDIGSIDRADHAWVMAEVSQGKWLAIEPQQGVVYPNPGSFYYRGYDFSADGPAREYNRVVRSQEDALKKYNDAVKVSDNTAASYNNGDWGAKTALLPILNQQRELVDMRLAEVQKMEHRISEIRQRATPSQ